MIIDNDDVEPAGSGSDSSMSNIGGGDSIDSSSNKDVSTESTLATIRAIMETQGITFEDVNRMIKLATATPAANVSKKKELEIVYKGIATYTCDTCGYEFDSTFNTNRRNMVVKYSVHMCHECQSRLLDCSKEELIDKIRLAYHHHAIQ